MRTLSLVLIAIGFCGTAYAAPHENRDGSVQLSDNLEGGTSVANCTIRQAATVYIATQAVCAESVHCTRSDSGVQLNVSQIDDTFYCPTTTARGCRGWRWQDCLLDTNLSARLLKCIMPAPVASAVSGCPAQYSATVPAEVVR